MTDFEVCPVGTMALAIKHAEDIKRLEDERDALVAQAHAAKTKAEEAELAAAQELDEVVAERDALAADAARYRYLRQAGLFRVIQPDMSGNHTWTGIGRPVGRGPTLDAAIDKLVREAS